MAQHDVRSRTAEVFEEGSLNDAVRQGSTKHFARGLVDKVGVVNEPRQLASSKNAVCEQQVGHRLVLEGGASIIKIEDVRVWRMRVVNR